MPSTAPALDTGQRHQRTSAESSDEQCLLSISGSADHVCCFRYRLSTMSCCTATLPPPSTEPSCCPGQHYKPRPATRRPRMRPPRPRPPLPACSSLSQRHRTLCPRSFSGTVWPSAARPAATSDEIAYVRATHGGDTSASVRLRGSTVGLHPKHGWPMAIWRWCERRPGWWPGLGHCKARAEGPSPCMQTAVCASKSMSCERSVCKQVHEL